MNCPICFFEHATEQYAKTRSGRVVICDNCGFAFSDPPQTEPIANDLPAVVDDPSLYLQNAKDRLKTLSKVTGITGGRLLDVGCFTGTFAAAAKELGFDVFGVEPVEQAAAKAEKDHGIKVFPGLFLEADIIGGPFDVISFIHTFEHMPDPHQTLKLCRKLLAPQGALLIETPNYDCRIRRILKSRWRQFIPDHALFYSHSTLARLLESEGFTLHWIENADKALSLRIFADRFRRYYHKGLGRAMDLVFSSLGLSDKVIKLNFGDIMLAVAVKKTVRIRDKHMIFVYFQNVIS